MLQRQSSWMAKGALVAVLGVGGGAQTAQAAVTYKVVPSQSKFVIYSKTASPLAKLRHTRELRSSGYTGNVVFSAPNKPASVTMNVKADSLKTVVRDDLNTSTAARVDLVTKRDILEAPKYPTINFKSTGINVKVNPGGVFKGTLKGNLSLHGVTRPVVVPVSGKVSGNTVTAKGAFTIKQSDYNITLISIMGGMLSAENPVTIDFNLVAKK